jgi:redox-sensitive bicupin YhaK (pirin superfamily)
MVIQSTQYDPRERLRLISRALQDLHRVLLEYQRRQYEKHFGRIGSDFYLLQLAAEDAEFAWLRTLSGEMMRIDTAISGDEDITEADLRLAGTRIRHLILPSESPKSFQSHYDRAMQTMPEVIMAHAGVMRSLPPASEVRLFRSDPPTDIRTCESAPGFEVRMHHPGEMVPGHGDHGYGPLAVIGESFMAPGTVIPMHRHANEEIISCVPEGVMRHDDGEGNTLVTDAGHLMVMNAGEGFDHAETTLEDDPPLRMLQIFVRPSALQLEPDIQHVSLPESQPGQWRNLTGLENEDYPAYVRNRVAMFDVVLNEGDIIELPQRDGWDTFVFVFDGLVEIDSIPFGISQAGLVLSPENVSLTARSNASLVSFAIDPAAKVTRAGTIGR